MRRKKKFGSRAPVCTTPPRRNIRTVFAEIQQPLVEHLNVLRVPLKRYRVTSFRIPRADGQQAAIVVLCHQIVQYGAVVNKSVEFPETIKRLEVQKNVRFYNRIIFSSYRNDASVRYAIVVMRVNL